MKKIFFILLMYISVTAFSQEVISGPIVYGYYFNGDGSILSVSDTLISIIGDTTKIIRELLAQINKLSFELDSIRQIRHNVAPENRTTENWKRQWMILKKMF